MKLGAYEIVAEVARGGMGVVYRARDTRLNRDVALKVLLRADEPTQVRRLIKEAESLARLRHPCIVGVHAIEEHAGRPVLVMDWVEGESLQQRIERDGPLSPPEAAELVRDLAGALAYAHGQGVLHRDLKPANVLIDGAGRHLLTDFGIARVVDDASRISQTGEMLGSPQYWAPEQATGELDQIGPATDVHGLGATLYAALTGSPLFHGAGLAECAIAALEFLPPTPFRAEGSDPALEAICLRCLAKEPTGRYAGAADLADELDRYLRGEATAPRRSRRWVTALAATSVLLLVGVGLRLRPSSAPPPRPALPGEQSSVTSDATAAKTAEEVALWIQRARARLARRELDRALQACDQALALDPEAHVALGLRGAARFLHGQRETGKADLERALALAPQDPDLQFHLGAARVLEGNRLGGIESFTTALKLDPGHLNSLLARADCYARLGRLDASEADARRAIAVAPKARGAHLTLGALAVRRERFAEALPHFDRAIELDPNYHQAFLERATTHTRLGNRAAAVRDYGRAIELAPSRPEAYFNRATLRLRDKDLTGAVEDYSECLRRDPNFIGALHGRGQAYAQLRRLDLAEQDLAAYVGKRPTAARPLKELTQVLFDQRKSAKALALSERALKLQPKDIELWRLRTSILFRLQRYHACVAAGTKALKLSPDDVKVLLVRGWSYANLSREPDAIRDLEHCLKVIPESDLRTRKVVIEGLRRLRAPR